MKYPDSLRWGAVCTAMPLLTGCVALAIAPTAALVGGMVNGSRDNLIQVSIDDKTMTPEVRAAFAGAKTLTVVAGDRSSIKAADIFETRGGYVVTIDRPTAKVGEMTGSERRDALRRLCASTRPDLALLPYVTKTETGNVMVGALTGRAKLKNEWTVMMLACRTNTSLAFGGTFEFDGGIYNQKAQSEFEELIGAEIGGKIMEAVGRGKTAQAPEIRPTAEPGRPQPLAATRRDTESSAKTVSMNTSEVQKRLLELGYQVGTPDGVMGRRTVEALRKFQQDNSLTVTGRVDAETVARISSLKR